MTDINKLETITNLKRGGHRSVDDGVCLLEACAFVAGELHTDRPQCVDPVLAAYGRSVNDWMTDDERKALLPLIPKLIGTKTTSDVSLRRAMLLVDGAIRQIVPMALDAAGLAGEANKLRALPEVNSENAAARAAAARAADAVAYAADAAARAAAAYAADADAADAAARAADAVAYAARAAARKPVVEAVLALFNAALEVK